MYITKLVYSNIEEFTNEEFTYLKDMGIIHETDYGTTELLQDTVYNLIHNSKDNYFSEEEVEHILMLLNERVGRDVVSMLDKGDLDTVMFVYD